MLVLIGQTVNVQLSSALPKRVTLDVMAPKCVSRCRDRGYKWEGIVCHFNQWRGASVKYRVQGYSRVNGILPTRWDVIPGELKNAQ